jgi:FkbM family methyltransferase
MSRQARTRGALRGIRRALAAAIAWLVAVFPGLEPTLVRLGRAGCRRSRVLAGLYWFVQERLMARLRKSGERCRPVFVLGRRLQLDITDSTGRYPFFYGTDYEPGVTDAIVTALGPGDVFVDVGANIGYFTVMAAKIVGDRGRVIAFEPHEGAREALEEAIHRNEAAATVDVVPFALADADGEAALFVEDAVTAHSTIEPQLSPMRHVAALRPGAMVRVTTLDGWLAARPDLSRRVRCIKIDVEGAEARVLAGMAQTLSARGLSILCETTLGSPADRMLAAAGYQWRRIEPGASSYGNFLYLRP